MKRLVAIVTALGVLIGAAVALAGPSDRARLHDEPARASSCPTNCQAIGQVTGFEAQQGTTKHPFQPTRRGKVVAFSITLGKPKDSDISFFNEAVRRRPGRADRGAEAGAEEEAAVHGQRAERRVPARPVLRLDPHLRAVPPAHREARLRGRPARCPPGRRRSPSASATTRSGAHRATPHTATTSSRRPRRPPAARRPPTAASTARRGLMYTVTFVPDPRVTNPPATKKKTGTTG